MGLATASAAPRGAVRRVLMTADAVGGVWTYALELASALAARDVRTTIAVMGPAPSEAQRHDAMRIAELHEGAFALEWASEPWDDVARAGDWLLELERSVRPDVVHVNGFAHCALPWSAPTVMVAHSCVCSWWRACRGERAPATWDRYREAVRAGISGADAIVAPTNAMLGAFCDEHDPERAHAARMRVIPNAADASRFAPGPEKLPLVLAAGRLWDEAKNIAALDAIAGELSWPVAVAGSGSAPADTDGERARFARSIALGVLAPTDLGAWMQHAAIYALPARYEPFGLSALEAALSGCALVLGDIPSLRELWDGAARFVDPRDPAALRGAIQLLIDDADARRALADRALQRARGLADLDRFATSYLDLYRALGAARARNTACA